MDKILVHGGRPLSGSIKISGSKNSALPILAATLLTREPCILHRVPDLSDTHYMLQMLTPKLVGAVVNLTGKFGPTVLGTDNVMMAGTLAEGVTVIEGAATEPEVVDLANFLNKMGAKIEGAGTRRLIIEGVKELHGAEHDVIPDRIEAGTFLIAGPICGQGVTGTRVVRQHLTSLNEQLTAGRHHI